ncbi:MAG: geranylgeranyl reductase family protein [Calditrichaeota bacterium]|nr:MAG: geranylgeranyl reductase family protein [Calditrichota bacterium]
MMPYDADIIVVGAGPAGATTALFARRHGLNPLLIDKKRFPRDKACGDAITRNALKYIRQLGLLDELLQLPHRPVRQALIAAPSGTGFTLTLTPRADTDNLHILCRRLDFDHFLVQAARRELPVLEGHALVDLVRQNGRVCGVITRDESGKQHTFTARAVVGADGFNSPVARRLGLYRRDSRRRMVATRAYYRQVRGLTGAVEIHYLEPILPGYLWIFPLDEETANVGVGLLHRDLKRRKFRLRQLHEELLTLPRFRERFGNARLIGDIQGWNLPTPDFRRRLYDAGAVLVGDAAGLVDPFTGEGIGNAMRSGEVAARVLAAACRDGEPTAARLSRYPRELWRAVPAGELRVHYRLQHLCRHPRLLNFVVARAAQFGEVRQWLTEIAESIEPGSVRPLASPLTYMKLLLLGFKK